MSWPRQGQRSDARWSIASQAPDTTNLKELRPASTGSTEIRILFVFDPRRTAILLVAGDKAGDWRGWYDSNVPLAEERYAEHLAALEETR